jgi:hypothetical protein
VLLVGAGEPGPGAPDARLHLVEPEQGAVRVARAPGGGEVARRRYPYACLSLDRLEDHGSRLVGDRSRERIGVAVRHEGDGAW